MSHLVLIIPGFGEIEHSLNIIKNRLSEIKNCNVLITNFNTIKDNINGIKKSSNNIIDYLKNFINDNGNFKFISIIGYSMGGLYARFIIYKLFENGKIYGLEPIIFCTIATPHLGLLENHYLSGITDLIKNNLVGVSGKEINLTDASFYYESLIFKMGTDDNFLKPLNSFKKKILYANYSGDLVVPFETSAIEVNKNILKNLDLPSIPSIVLNIKNKETYNTSEGFDVYPDKVENIRNLIANKLSPLFEKKIVYFPNNLYLTHYQIVCMINTPMNYIYNYKDGLFIIEDIFNYFIQQDI